MLAAIENKMEELFEVMEALPADKIEAAEKVSNEVAYLAPSCPTVFSYNPQPYSRSCPTLFSYNPLAPPYSCITFSCPRITLLPHPILV
jgi:hypothetical protein